MTTSIESIEFIRARHIARSLNEAVSCLASDDSSVVAKILEERQFSSCPVLDAGVPIGILTAFDCQPRLTAREAMQPIGLKSVISADTFLLDAARKLLASPFQLILEGSHLTGFLTEADLGSATGKSFAYLKLAAVEVNLCKFLRRRYADEGSILSTLNEKRKFEVEGLITNLKLSDQYIDHFASLGLSDLLQIAGRQPDFKERVKQFGGWQRLTRGLPNLRNDVMHPDRPLLGQHRQLESFVEKIQNLESIQSALQMCIDSDSRHGNDRFHF
ncbi:CBS domain-containing protein [Arthrobacter glacialis]|uniref:CBS domain-containing protein n=1 Tax=Arthrobacter glacialis TaxID=1664 RepID=UPI000D48D35B|nr:CBS domain-containing protein [Arthrobacter glacialis]POH60155.1 hypothetical protein CVS28_04210 [Arthrobacter glacialis]